MPADWPIDTAGSPVRQAVADYWPYTSHVRIDDHALEAFADRLEEQDFRTPDWAYPNFIGTDAPAEDVLDFLFLVNTVNFAFRDFDTGERFAAELHGEEWPGAFGMIACFRRAYDDGLPVLDGEYLAALDLGDVAELFAPSNGVEMPMLDERTEILNSVGQRLADDYDGRFHSFVDDCSDRLYGDGGGVAARLVEEFPSFRDDRRVLTGAGTFTVRFDKRAQLAAAMAHARLPDDVFAVEDPESFTVYADYNLPNILRHHGVLEYSDQLALLVDRETPIPEGSRMETDVRAATIAATDRLLAALNGSGRRVTGMHLDAALFAMKDDVDTPVHRTRTTAY